jgi:hypothetical protein
MQRTPRWRNCGWRWMLRPLRAVYTTTMMQIANRVYSLAQEQNDSASLTKAFMALAATH